MTGSFHQRRGQSTGPRSRRAVECPWSHPAREYVRGNVRAVAQMVPARARPSASRNMLTVSEGRFLIGAQSACNTRERGLARVSCLPAGLRGERRDRWRRDGSENDGQGGEDEGSQEDPQERQGGSGQADLQPGALEGHGEGLEVRGRGGRGRPRRGGGLASDRGSPAALVDGRRSGPDWLLRWLGLGGRRRALSHGGGGQAQEVPDASRHATSGWPPRRRTSTRCGRRASSRKPAPRSRAPWTCAASSGWPPSHASLQDHHLDVYGRRERLLRRGRPAAHRLLFQSAQEPQPVAVLARRARAHPGRAERGPDMDNATSTKGNLDTPLPKTRGAVTPSPSSGTRRPGGSSSAIAGARPGATMASPMPRPPTSRGVLRRVLRGDDLRIRAARKLVRA